jgi:mannosyl-oligosaccharide alpha-1,2-mannosidase
MSGIKVLNRLSPSNGLYPIKVSLQDGQFADSHITFGALGDSFYEYLLKTWVQGGRREAWLRDMYDRAMDGMIKVLLKASSPNGLAFVSDYNGNGTYACPSHSDYVPIYLYGQV